MKRIVKKPEERRKEIISASRELFLKKEYEKTMMQDVMEKLQIAKGTTYHYFKSKTELLQAVVQDMVDEYLTTIKESLNQSQGNALEKMKALIALGKVREKETVNDLHRPGNIGMHTRLLAITTLRLAPLYASVIEQGCKEGIFQVEHPLECAEFLLAGIQFITDLGCYPWKQEDLKRRAHAIPSLIEAQLHAPKESFNFLIES